MPALQAKLPQLYDALLTDKKVGSRHRSPQSLRSLHTLALTQSSVSWCDECVCQVTSLAAYRALTLSADKQGDGSCLEARVTAWFYNMPCHIYLSAGEGLLLELVTVTRQDWNPHPRQNTAPVCPSVEWCWLGSCSVQPSDEVCLLISDDCGSGLRLIHLDSHVCCRPPPPQSPWPHRHPCTPPTSTPTMAVGLCLFAGPRRPIVAAGQFALFQRHGSAAAKRGAALRASTPRRWRQWRRRQWRRRRVSLAGISRSRGAGGGLQSESSRYEYSRRSDVYSVPAGWLHWSIITEYALQVVGQE